MEREKKLSGVDTTFKDKDGNAIFVHSYVKDADGRKYFINSHLQAVPGDDAPAVELSRLLESSEVTVMTAEEVLEAKPIGKRIRRLKKDLATPKPVPPETVQVEAKQDKKEDLTPVTMQMMLSVIPDDVLADELRRRGYYLTAVKPALVQL